MIGFPIAAELVRRDRLSAKNVFYAEFDCAISTCHLIAAIHNLHKVRWVLARSDLWPKVRRHRGAASAAAGFLNSDVAMALGRPTVRTFVPEQMGHVDCFAAYSSETYKLNDREKRAVSGVLAHFDKAQIFYSLAEGLRPGLDIDQNELETHSYTSANHGRQLSAVVESVIVELYACIDCTAKVLRAIYEPDSQGFKNSTRALFGTFERITGTFPEEIKALFRSVTWYSRLLHLRDELTHLGIGRCDLNMQTKQVRYMHGGLKLNGEMLQVPDVYVWLWKSMEDVDAFVEAIFAILEKTLKNTPVPQSCGWVDGRALMRMVDPTQEITFDNGTCLSFRWFEQEEMPTCPFVGRCGAYARTRPGIDPASLFPKPQ